MTLLTKIFKNRGNGIVLRTIRNGRVKINGYWFEPDKKPMCPELEGTRSAFGVYWTGDYKMNHFQMEDFVCLWGGEEMFNAINDEDFVQACDEWHKGVTDDDGYLRWAWWRSDEATRI